MDYIVVAFTIILVAIPEGLILAVIIAMGAQFPDNLIHTGQIPTLRLCEIMAGVDNICVDKTGTIT